MKLLLSCICLFLVFGVSARTVLDVKFPESKVIEGKKLILNGVGIRKATIFSVKVYVGALYMEKKSKTANKFLDWKSPKYIEMHFVRDVDKDDIVGGWVDAFKNALGDNLKAHKKQIDKFNSLMEDMKEKDSMILTFTDKGVQSVVKGKKKDFIADKNFAKALLSVWFINAGDTGLRDGLLGI